MISVMSDIIASSEDTSRFVLGFDSVVTGSSIVGSSQSNLSHFGSSSHISP